MKPETVPERIWNLWLDHRETNAIWDPCSDAPEFIHPRPATEKVILDRECGRVWSTLDRRYDECAVRFIFDLIQDSFDGPAGGGALIPHAVRKRHGTRLASLARELAQELASLRGLSASSWFHDGPAPLPTEIYRELIRMPLAATQLVGTPTKEENTCRLVRSIVVPEKIVDYVLSYLERGAEQWSNSSPVVDERSSNPLRLHFVRSMTIAFHNCFELPMREQVAALTRCLYGSSIDASTVAKLAPLNKDALP